MNKNFLKIIFVSLFLITIFGNISATYIPDATMKIFAVTGSNVAMDATLHAEIRPGTGRIFSSIHTIVGSQTQESERNAVIAATTAVGNDTRNKYDFYFDIQSSASSIDGPSAGGAIALLLVSMLSGNDLNQKVSITGSITSDGYIGDVGGVYAKAKKASEVGIKLFMIPMGNRQQVITNQDGSTDLVDLIDYSYSNWDMKIVEVQTIDDVLKYSSMDIENIDINNPIVTETDNIFVPEKIQVSRAINPMRGIVDKYLNDVNVTITSTEKSVDTSIIKDSTITQGLISLLSYAKDSVNRAEVYSNYNYLYTAANEAFLAKIYGMVISEVMDNPSILSQNSTIYNLKISELEKKLALTENRAKMCSLEKMEWCIGARQRITWARNKIEDLKIANKEVMLNQSLDKIMDYGYASGWIEIANDFLDIGIVSQGNNFKESSDFKDRAESYIVDIENQLTISDESIISDTDLQRRLKAAKTNLNKGWYVSSLFDAATAKAVLISKKENNSDLFSEAVFKEKYDVLLPILRSNNGLNSTNHIWSKQFFDHSLYYYKKYLSYENKNDTRAITDLKTANSIINFSVLLYDVEKEVIAYYDNASIDIITEIIDIEIVDDNLDTTNLEQTENSDKVYYVYTKNNKEKLKTVYLYIYIIALFAMIISVVIYIDRNSNKKIKLQKKLAELDEKLLDGKISEFTYKEMRAIYLKELKAFKDVEKVKKKYELDKSTINKTTVNKMTSVKDMLKIKKDNKK